MRVSADEEKIIKSYRMGANLDIYFHNETAESAFHKGRQFGKTFELSELIPEKTLSGDFGLAPRANVHLFVDI